MDEERCVADFKLRSKTRLTYPGACSLEYQNIKKIVIETLLQWDCIKQKPKEKGVVGTLRAFAPGDDWQSRGTLHSHWKIFIEELTNEVRSALFEGNESDRTKAQQKIIDHIDKVMNEEHAWSHHRSCFKKVCHVFYSCTSSFYIFFGVFQNIFTICTYFLHRDVNVGAIFQ